MKLLFFLFWWDVALYPTLKQTAVLGCIKSSTSAVTRALRCQLRGRPFHPWAGRLRFSGEAHPGPATLTQSSSFSCGAGLQSESRLPQFFTLGYTQYAQVRIPAMISLRTLQIRIRNQRLSSTPLRRFPSARPCTVCTIEVVTAPLPSSDGRPNV